MEKYAAKSTTRAVVGISILESATNLGPIKS